MSDFEISQVERAFLSTMRREQAQEFIEENNKGRKLTRQEKQRLIHKETDKRISADIAAFEAQAQQPKESINFEPAVFQTLLTELRREKIPASTAEFLNLQTVLEKGVVRSLNDLYIVARAVLVKDVAHYHKYDVVFAKLFGGYITENVVEVGEEGEKKEEEKQEQQQNKQEKMEPKEAPKEENQSKTVVEQPGKTEKNHGGDDAHKAIKDSPASAKDGQGSSKPQEKKEKNAGKGKSNQGAAGGCKNEHGTQGGNLKDGSIGGGNISDARGVGGMGEYDENSQLRESKGKGKDRNRIGLNERGVGIGGLKARLERDVFKEFDGDETVTASQFERILAKLTTIISRASEFEAPKLDMKATVDRIAQNGGLPELVYSDEEESKPSMVILFDFGGSTDKFIPIVQNLFKASKEVIHELQIYYFHNTIYGCLMKSPGYYLDKLGSDDFVPLETLLRKDSNTKVIIVGDQQMGYVEDGYGGLYDTATRFNDKLSGGYYEKSGYENLLAIRDTFPATVWINPLRESERQGIIRKDLDRADSYGSSMQDLLAAFSTYELTMNGLEQAVRKIMEE